MAENSIFSKPVYIPPTSQPSISYQSNQIYSSNAGYSSLQNTQNATPIPSTINLTNSLYGSNNSVSQLNSSINNCMPVNTNSNHQNNGPYHGNLTQSAFGGFNFGMGNTPLCSINSNSNNQNSGLKRGAIIGNR